MVTNPAIALMLAAILALAGARTAAAGPLAPSKPSQLATLSVITDSLAITPCEMGGTNGLAVDKVLRPDGSSAIFEIPPGYVFIATHVSWLSSATGQILVLGPDGGAMPQWLIPAGSQNGGSYQLPSLVVASGGTLCASVSAGLGGITVGGYLTKDK